MKHEFIKGKKVLIAGGAGLVGQNLVRVLMDLGALVSATYCTKKPLNNPDLYGHADLTRFDDCLSVTKGMDVVICCAAKSFGAKMMKENPSAAVLPNLTITTGLLEACRINRVHKIIIISSSTVYQPANYPIGEHELDLNQEPFKAYAAVGWLNRYIEQLARFYYQQYQMPIGIIRASNIYGPHDKFDDERSNVLPALIKRALAKPTPFEVWGDGQAVRDFIFVDDFIEDLLDVLEKHCVADPVNSGNGQPMSIAQAAKIILEVCQHQAPLVFDPTKPSAIPYRMISIAKLEAIAGKRQRTAFIDGIKKTVDWYQEAMKVTTR